jgi:hypothetical protein
MITHCSTNYACTLRRCNDLPGHISYGHPPRTASFYYVHATLITIFGNYFAELASWVKSQSTTAPGGKFFSSVVVWRALTLTLPPRSQASVGRADNHNGTHTSERPSFLHWDEVTQVMRCLLVIGPSRRGLQLCRACLDSEL